jgi:asparagine synthase (glutamine-hydrolysing)
VLAELSGGYDSSAIVCMADEVLNHLSTQSSRVDTFSYCFPDEPESDDHLYFVKVQEKRGRGGHSAMILGTGDSFSPEYSKFVATPGFGARREVTCARDAVARDSGYRVILSGIGGDEFMGQALDPRVQMADLLSHLRLHALNKELLAWSILTRRPWIQLAAETLLLLLPSSVRARFTAGARPDAWLDPAFAKRYNFSYLLLQASAGPFSWRPSARDSLQTYLTLSGLLTNSSPENQEIRYPYLDRDLFEFLTSIPPGQILRPGDRRSLMRRALVGVVPAEILARKTKQSETRCHIVTLAKHWDRIEEHISAPLSATCGFINKSEFRAALIAAKNGKMSRHFLFLLRALSFELWFQYVTKNNIITLPQHCASNIPASSDNALAVLS